MNNKHQDWRHEKCIPSSKGINFPWKLPTSGNYLLYRHSSKPETLESNLSASCSLNASWRKRTKIGIAARNYESESRGNGNSPLLVMERNSKLLRILTKRVRQVSGWPVDEAFLHSFIYSIHSIIHSFVQKRIRNWQHLKSRRLYTPNGDSRN